MTSELEPAEQQLRIYEAILIAVERRMEVLDIVSNSASVEEAHQSLTRQLGLDEIQAQAVLDLQVRRFATDERDKIATRVDEIRAYVAQLRG